MTHKVEQLRALCQGQIQPCGWWRNIQDGNGRAIVIGSLLSTIYSCFMQATIEVMDS